MSVHVISWVLKHSNSAGNDRLTLLVFADHADDDGRNTWPSADTIAFEGRMRRPTAVAARKRLREQGRIIEIGPGPRGTTNYQVRMEVAAEGPPPPRRRTDEEKGVKKLTPASGSDSSASGVRSDASGGNEIEPEPSIEPSTKPSREQDGLLPSAIEEIFDYWRSTFSLNGKTKLTAGRRRALQARLREGYSADRIKRAILGCAGSDFHVKGEHTDLTLICRSGDKLERFERMPPPTAAAPPSEYDRPQN